ncbi:hypothetical protein L218DRAFT_1079564 [Marasmius fiardii PR-910]|nr:hypothetical protein L218DRAFT_1079564 [Marasmius fiardii PR-910]
MSQPVLAHNIPSFSISKAVSNLQSTANSFHASGSPTSNAHASTSRATFTAPAHKHAHHLHSIPPREKSTRTLIIDHMLWVHGRTRFAQARAELGMTDRTGGPSSSNYQHRYRPENYEEEDETTSDGEDAEVLKARSSPHEEDEETRLRTQDLSLAKNLRLRAEGLEKVVTSMLVQLPPINPIIDDDLDDPPTSPKVGSSSSHSRPQHQHTLPNGVRLRLALTTVINDLFARQTPPQPSRNKRYAPASPPSTTRETEETTSASAEAGPSSSFLPPALCLLSPISAYPHSHHPHDTEPPGDSVHSSRTPSSSRSKRPLRPNARARTLYQSGADPETANSPPGLRCPRHLHTSCEICVEAKSSLRPLSVSGHKQSNPGSMGPPGTSFINGIGTGSTWNSWKGTPIGIAPDGGGISGWQDGSGIGSGLLRPGVQGTLLRRRSRDGESGSEDSSSGRGATKLSELIPRFLRLSALVAAELGREVREAREVEGALVDSGESSDSEDDEDEGSGGEDDGIGTTPHVGGEESHAHLHNRFYLHALRPSREWYLLLAGLLTRAALQGYLSAGWRGTDAVECLMTIGLGLGPDSGAEDPDADWEEFEPDELPSLIDSVKMLFPSRTSKTRAAEEYEIEMNERLRKFFDIPLSTPDLSTHMEDLAWQYPAEAVERAAVRFCEAMAKWRGKPELETYKKKPSSSKPPETSSDELAMTIESLVHSNPSSPSGPYLTQRRDHHKRKPIIELYFLQPVDSSHHLSSPLQSPLAAHSRPSLHFLSASTGASPSFNVQSQSRLHQPQSTQNLSSGMLPAMIMGTNTPSWGWSDSSRGGTKRPSEEDIGNSSKKFRGS